MGTPQRIPDLTPMTEPSRGIDLGWVKHLMEEEYNPRDWREANELALLALMDIQEHWGYVSEDAAEVVADHLGIELQRVYHLLTFYADLRTTPRAAHTYTLCDGAACHTLGSGELLDQVFERLGITQRGQTSADGKVTVEIWSGCMGACQIGPMANVDGKYVGFLTAEKVGAILDELQGVDTRGREPAPHDGRGESSFIAGGGESRG
jgi:NADH-quinone oxidoreductase subunit E